MKLLILFLFTFNAFGGASTIPDKDANGKIIQSTDAFAAKHSYNFHGVGIECAVAANTTTSCEFAINVAHAKFNGLAMINTAIGDKANLKILDTAAGTYTLQQVGTAIPNYTLNQFGFNWNLYHQKTIELLPYPADLYQGMRIVVEYINGPVAKTVYVNYYLHKE